MGVMIGIILVAVAGLTIVAVMIIVLQEKHEHEEQYIPGTPETHAEPTDKPA